MKTIAWDVDDVLNELTYAWFDGAFAPAHPDCAVTDHRQLVQNPPHRLLGISRAAYLASLDDFRPQHYADLEPLPGALGWFQRHGARHHHVALTATPLCGAPASAQWVMRHFGRWIRGFMFVPSPREGTTIPAYDGSKGALCRRAGIHLLVDDSPHNVQDARDHDVAALLFARPWNQTGSDESADPWRALRQPLQRALQR